MGATAGAPAIEKREPASAADYAKAILLGLIAAVVGAYLWDKFVILTQIQFGLIAALVGILVGIAVRIGSGGKAGIAFQVIGAVLALFGMLLGYTLIGYDVVVKELGEVVPSPIVAIPRLLPLVVRHLDLLDWVFVAIGAWEGWAIPRQAAGDH